MDHLLQPIQSQEIPDLITRASLHGGKILQTCLHSPLETRISQIHVEDSGAIKIKLSEKIPLASERPISIKLNYRRVNFYLDSTQYSVDGDTITGLLPKSARALALRDSDRYALPLNSQIHGGFHRIEKRGGCSDFNAHLIDISKQGLGLLIPQSEPGLMMINDHLWLKTLHHYSLPRAIFGKVVYAQDRKFKDGFMETKLGISLNTEIPEEIFEEIRLMSHFKLKV